jgi:hypothetical protein
VKIDLFQHAMCWTLRAYRRCGCNGNRNRFIPLRLVLSSEILICRGFLATESPVRSLDSRAESHLIVVFRKLPITRGQPRRKDPFSIIK